MKSSALLANLARGGCVDQTALIDALNQEKIAGAALDVFVEEPLPSRFAPLDDKRPLYHAPYGRRDASL